MIFFDFETWGDVDLGVAGSDRYVRDERTQAYMLSWTRADDPEIRVWDLWCEEENANDQLNELARAVDDGEPFIAWNARFDRLVWNHAFRDEHEMPELPIEQVYDAMALSSACGYPNSLDHAAKAARVPIKKDMAGSKAMKQLMYRSVAEALPRDELMELVLRTRRYAGADVGALRGLWRYFRPMSAEEWHGYHVSERINDRGITIDAEFCEKAYSYHGVEQAYLADEIQRLTDGAVTKLTETLRINKWMWNNLPEGLQPVLETTTPEKGDFAKGRGVSCDRAHLAALRDAVDEYEIVMPPETEEVIDVIEWGRSASAVKFRKMVDQAVDYRLMGQYAWNGAGQTGRYSSRGVQIHNLPREAVDNELDLIDEIVAGMPVEKLRALGPVSLTLSRLIRPAFIAPEGKVFVWGDWSAIEARVLPWLADSPDAERVLHEYREGVDRYRVTAAEIFNTETVTGLQRQAGKVAVLALGFGGYVNAYRSMARGYGLRFRVEEAKPICDGWRENNPWAQRFWDELREAAYAAIRHPGRDYQAGRVTYEFINGLMGGTLVCWLPCGRPLVYPECKISDVMFEDKKTGEITVKRSVINYRRGMGRATTWHGKQAENVTQAVAGSILRDCLDQLDDSPWPVVAHTHDEIVLEVREDLCKMAEKDLSYAMTIEPNWAEGLPLNVELTTDVYYHK